MDICTVGTVSGYTVGTVSGYTVGTVSGYTVGTVGIPYVKLKISRGNFFYSDMAE